MGYDITSHVVVERMMKMQGLEVLNKTVVTETPYWGEIFVCSSIFLIVIFFIILANTNSTVLQIISAVLIVLTIIIDAILCSFEVPTDRYRYEVTIDKNVTIEEIYENYDVIEQRGDIWVLEDKEKE